MLIDVDSRKPLMFKRKVASPEGEEATIQINYEKLFKHCKTCGFVDTRDGLLPIKRSYLREPWRSEGGVRTGKTSI